MARRNAARHGVGRSHRRSATAICSTASSGRFDADRRAIRRTSSSAAAPALQPEVRDYEPAVALFGGSEGFDLVTRLVAEAPSHLRPGGYLVFEFGLGQDVRGRGARRRARRELRLVELRRDLQGIARHRRG